MKGGCVHNYNHFTGKKKSIAGHKRKKPVKKKQKTHVSKYENVHDNIIIVDKEV